MKVIFLDFDGVLNNMNCLANGYMFSDYNMKNLAKIIKTTNAKIVLSTSHRNNQLSLHSFNQACRKEGINDLVYGKTDVIPPTQDVFKNKRIRPTEIEMWLDDHPEVKRYVIIDDMDMIDVNNFVQTNFHYGLTEVDADKAIKILKK